MHASHGQEQFREATKYKNSLFQANKAYAPRDKTALSKSAFYKNMNPASSEDELDSNQVLSDSPHGGKRKSPQRADSILKHVAMAQSLRFDRNIMVTS